MEENMKYEEAMTQIETIVHKMENNEHSNQIKTILWKKSL